VLSTYRFCTGCADERAFVQPPCQDDHGLDCPELACVDCGLAIMLGDAPLDDAREGILTASAA